MTTPTKLSAAGGAQQARQPRKMAIKQPQTPTTKPHGLGQDMLVLSGTAQAKSAVQASIKPPELDSIEQAVDLALRGEDVQLRVTNGNPDKIHVKLLEHGNSFDSYEVTTPSGIYPSTSQPVGLTLDQVKQKYVSSSPMALKIGQCAPSDTRDRYQVGLGDVRLDLSVAKGAEVRPFLNQVLRSYSNVTEKLRMPFVSLELAEGMADARAQIKTRSGELVELTLRNKGTEAGMVKYDVTFSGHVMQLEVPEGHGFPWDLGWLVQQVMMEPAHPKQEQAIELALGGDEVKLDVPDGHQPIPKVTLIGRDQSFNYFEVSKPRRNIALHSGSTPEEVNKLFWDAKSMALTVKAGAPSDTRDRYQVGLGDVRLDLSVAKGADVRPVLNQVLSSYSNVTEQLRMPFVSLELAEGMADARAQIKTRSGELVELTLRNKGTEAGMRHYDLEFEGQTLRFNAPEAQQFPWEAGWVVQQYLLEPAALRSMLRQVEENAGPSPKDPEFAARFNQRDFKSAATAGNGEIDFWSGQSNMSPKVLHHEFGHVIGQHFNKQTLHPVGWEEAIKADSQWVSDYAQKTPDEDFAETWMTYQDIQNPFTSGVPAMTMDEFKQRYPHRAAIIEAMISGERKPVK